MKTINIIRLAAAVALCVGSAGAFAQVAVVVNAKSPVATHDRRPGQRASSWARATRCPSGGTAVPTDLPDSAPAHELFYTKVTGKNTAQVKAAWSRLVFSGKATPPKELALRRPT